MSALLDSNPEYKAVQIIKVDWDRFSRADIVSELKVPRRSTLVFFANGQEVGRVVASTNADDIGKLFDKALKA